MIAERKAQGAYKDIFDFCRRIDNQTANRRVIEALIKAGAFDSLHPNRAEVLANLEMAMEYGVQQNNNANQGGLFDEVSDAIEEVKLTPHPAWSLSQLLAEEKQVLGFYFSAHPFSPYAEEVRPLARTPLANIQVADNKQWLSGFVIQLRTILTKNGNKMTIAVVEDESSKNEIVLRSEAIDAFIANNGELTVDQVLLFECKISKSQYNENDDLRIFAEKILSLDEGRQNYARTLNLNISTNTNISTLSQILTAHKAGKRTIPLKLWYRTEKVSGCLNTDANWLIAPNQALIDELHGLLGHKNVRVRW